MPTGAHLLVGVDANYSLDMERNGTRWGWNGAEADLFQGMANHGVTRFRVRLWTKDDGPHGKVYATQVVKRALRAGLNPYLVIFLSEDWADMMKQPLPQAWSNLSFDERAAAVHGYSRNIVAHFRKEGLESHLYEIGNEIDYGICGEYPGKSAKKDPTSLSKRIWPRSAQLILASQAGVREADPEAQFMLHIAHWWDPEFCAAFFRFMLAQGVQIDYVGLSYFPSSNIGGSLEMAEFGATVSRVSREIGRPVIVAETAYPSTSDFKGQFSRWRYEVLGYPLSPEGQSRWIADFFAFCNHRPDIHAVYYWSPEWCGEGMWKAFALFEPDGKARPAWAAFSPASWGDRTPREPVYLEVRSNRLFVVPYQAAKEQTAALVAKLREQTGGVTVEHIAWLTNTELRVGPYAVNLKASLQNNLCLTLVETGQGVPLAVEGPASTGDLEAIANAIDPARQNVVMILRDGLTPEVRRAVRFFEEHGIQVYLHPRQDETPLRFGMCGEFQ